MAYEVLAEAGGSASAQDLSKVLAARLDLQPSPTFVQLSANTWPEPGRSVDPANPAITDIAARQLWMSLTPDEQAVVPLLAADPDEVAAQLRTGPETAAAVQAAVREKAAPGDRRHRLLRGRAGDPPCLGG